jgi:hypothetical protein
MRSEFDVVRLRHARGDLPAGALGTIMGVSPSNPSAYLVEFCGLDVTDSVLVDLLEEDLETGPSCRKADSQGSTRKPDPNSQAIKRL